MSDLPKGVPRRNELLHMLQDRLRQLEATGGDDDTKLLLRASIYNMAQVDVTSDYASENARMLREVKKGVEIAVDGIYAQMKAELNPSDKRQAYKEFATKANGGRQAEIEIKEMDLKYRFRELVTSRGFIVLLIVIYMFGQWLGIEIPIGEFLGKG